MDVHVGGGAIRGHTGSMILFLLACGSPGDSGADSGGDLCPMLDCRDALSLTILSPDGEPSAWFDVSAYVDGVAVGSWMCGSTGESFEGATCYGDGRVDLYLYAEVLEIHASEGADAPSWSGSLSPAWTAPYDSEACGHYCWLADETIELEPCDGCG